MKIIKFIFRLPFAILFIFFTTLYWLMFGLPKKHFEGFPEWLFEGKNIDL